MRRTATTMFATGVTAAAIIALAVGVAGGQTDDMPATATVETADVTRSVSASGTLRASTTWTLSHQAEPHVGTTTVAEKVPSSTRVTALPDVGVVVPFGGELYATDDRPTLLLPGSSAAWRTLGTGDTDGVDVAQLEAYLAEAGYATGTVDEHFDADTEAAVELWQEASGLEVTGAVALGSVVFAATPLTVESVSTTVGATVGDGDAMVVVRSADLVVDLAVASDLAPYLVVGDELQVRLPDGSSVAATVTAVVKDPDRGRVALALLAEAPALAVTPVAVTATRTITLATDALVVPTESIIHVEGGVDAVRLADGTLVVVELGPVSGAQVAITRAELADGDTIVLP